MQTSIKPRRDLEQMLVDLLGDLFVLEHMYRDIGKMLDGSHTGELHVSDIRAVFPDQSRWMFYDIPLPRPEAWH